MPSSKKADPQEILCRATDTMLDIGYFAHYMDVVDVLYSTVSFKDKEKFLILGNAKMKVQDLTEFEIYRKTTDYNYLLKVVVDFDVGRRECQSGSRKDHSLIFPRGRC